MIKLHLISLASPSTTIANPVLQQVIRHPRIFWALCFFWAFVHFIHSMQMAFLQPPLCKTPPSPKAQVNGKWWKLAWLLFKPFTCSRPCRCTRCHRVVYARGSHQGEFVTHRDVWQHVEILWIVKTESWGSGVLLASSRGQGCCSTSYEAQDSPHNKESSGPKCQQRRETLAYLRPQHCHGWPVTGVSTDRLQALGAGVTHLIP